MICTGKLTGKMPQFNLARKLKTKAKQAQACNTAPCLRISDIFT